MSDQLEAEARWFTCEWLLREVSGRFDIDHAAARMAMTTLPPNLIPMFDSAEGVAALGSFIAGALGRSDCPPFEPTIQ